jgi:lysozyme
MASRLVKGTGIGAIAALGLLAIALIGTSEGLRLYAYQDVVGVWTACYGETKGIKRGMKFTGDECDVMFISSLTEHEAGMRACLRQPDAIPDKVYVAALSLAYNIGVGAFCRSSIPRKLDAGDWRAACGALLQFNKAGRPLRPVRGLTKRRERERTFCLEGIGT